MNERSVATMTTFGDLLKRLRKRASMTQDNLAAATGYSRSLIGALERGDRLPDVEVVIQTYLPALGLQEEPLLAAQLVELAANARGERPPAPRTFRRERRVVGPEEAQEATSCWPVPPTEILGRDQEITHLCDRVLGHTGRLLTLVGPPGVGKTRLAQAVGAQLLRFYRDGACFVPLAKVNAPEIVASTLVAALGLPAGSTRPPRSRLIEHLRRKQMLLVLDNFEQLITADSPAIELLVDLLAECPDLCLLVTSRERLHLRAEQRYHVQPLALTDAVELFAQRSAAVDADFVLTEKNRATIEAICEQVDRLPLALELCAAQVDFLSPAQLLAGLQDRRLDQLVGGARDLPPQQRTLRRAIEYSYNLLDDEERTLLRSLGVFVGGCALEEIEVVSAWAQTMPGRSLPSTLQALVGKSLVGVETVPGGAGRYSLLETIREFALERARAENEENALRQRHYAAYLQLFRTADRPLRGPEVITWLARLEPEQDNLHAALQWTLNERRYEDVAWLVLAAAWFWFYSGRWQYWIRWSTELRSYQEVFDADLRLACLDNLCWMSHTAEEFQLTEQDFAEMMVLAESCSNTTMRALTWYHIAENRADPAVADAAWARAIADARAGAEEPPSDPEFGCETDNHCALSAILWAHADILVERGEFAQAAPLIAESYELSRTRGNRYRTADILGVAGRLSLLQGDLVQAQARLHEAVTLAGDLKYQQTLGEFQSVLGLVALYSGDVPAARRLLDDSLHLCLDLNNARFLGRVCTYLAEMALWDEQLEEAARWLAQTATHYAFAHPSQMDQIERLVVTARLATAQGAYLRAASLFGTLEETCRQIHYEPVGPARDLADAALATVRAALDPADFARAFAAGQRLKFEDAFGASPEAGVSPTSQVL